MREELTPEARQSSENRSVILSLAGFTFAAAVALPAIQTDANPEIATATFWVILGFLCYLAALNAQTYKFNRWQDQLAGGLSDIGEVSLIIAILFMFSTLNGARLYRVILTLTAFSIVVADALVRGQAWNAFFRAKEKYGIQNEQDTQVHRDEPA